MNIEGGTLSVVSRIFKSKKTKFKNLLVVLSGVVVGASIALLISSLPHALTNRFSSRDFDEIKNQYHLKLDRSEPLGRVQVVKNIQAIIKSSDLSEALTSDIEVFSYHILSSPIETLAVKKEAQKILQMIEEKRILERRPSALQH